MLQPILCYSVLVLVYYNICCILFCQAGTAFHPIAYYVCMYIYMCVLCCTVLHVIIALSLYHYMIPCVLYSYYAHFKNSRPYYVISCFVKLCILSQYITLCHIVTYHVTLNHVISHRYHDHIVL